MSADKKSAKNTKPQSRTMHNSPSGQVQKNTKAASLSKKSFKFRWWYAAILVIVIALVGVLVVRLSRASQTYILNCNTQPCANAFPAPGYVAVPVLTASPGQPVWLSLQANKIFGQNNGVTDMANLHVCFTLVSTTNSVAGKEYALQIQNSLGAAPPDNGKLYGAGTVERCQDRLVVEPPDNNTYFTFNLFANSEQIALAQVRVDVVAVTNSANPTPPISNPTPVPIIVKPTFGDTERTNMDAAIRLNGNLQQIEQTCNSYSNKDECENYFREAIKPIGNVESFSCKATSTLNGWAADPTAMRNSIRVDTYIDGPAGSGAFGFPAQADKSRPDTGGNHGFNAVMPKQFLNGQTHTAYVYGIGQYGSKEIGRYQFKCEQPPVGNVESITSNNTFNASINGWTLDQSNPNVPLEVHAYYDGPAGQGKDGAVFKTNIFRPDVNSAYGATGNHGFSIPLNPKYLDGKQHSIYLYAIGINQNGTGSGDNTWLTEQKFGLFNINAAPRGNVDALNCKSDNKNTIDGWAFDPNDPNASINVHVYVDGKGAAIEKADKPRPDVNKAYGIGGNHGFSIGIPQQAQDGRQHTIQVYAIGLGVNNPAWPQLNPMISPPSNINFACNRLPEGNLESVSFSQTANNYECIAHGWAYDPSAPDLAAQVAVYFDFNSDFTKWSHQEVFSAKNSRADLKAAKKGNGNHGFNYGIPSKFFDGKEHTIYAYALNMDDKGKYLAFDNRFIGSKTFTCKEKQAGTTIVNAAADTTTTNTQTRSTVTEATNKNDNKTVTVINTKAPINYDQTRAAEDLKSAVKDVPKVGNPQVIPKTIPGQTQLANNDAEDKQTTIGKVFIRPSLPKDIGVNQTAIYIDGKNPTIYKSDDVTQELDTRLMTNGEHTIQTLAYADDNNVFAVAQTIKVDNKPLNPLLALWLRLVSLIQRKPY